MSFWREDLGLLPPDPGDRLLLDGTDGGWNSAHAYSLTNLTALAYEPEETVRSFLAERGWTLSEYRSLPHRPLFKVWSHTGWFAARKGDDLVVAVRGTEPPNLLNWATNLAIAPVRASRFILEAGGRIHLGFGEAFSAMWPSLEVRLREFADRDGKRVWIAGHSLGGAVALLCASQMAFHAPRFGAVRLAGLYTCGQPRVGNREFADSITPHLGRLYFRIVHGNDIVPHVPPEFLAPNAVKRVASFFGKLFGIGERKCDYAHAGMLRYLPPETGECTEALPPGCPRSVEEIAARLAPAFPLLRRMVIAGRQTLAQLPAEIRHHFPMGSAPEHTAYVPRLRSFLAS